MRSTDPLDEALGFAARWLLVFTVAIAIVLFAACSHTCPKPPPCVPPPPVVVVKTPPPCTLPELPAPIQGLGVPDAQRDGYFVPRQRWAELGGYVAGVREWIISASACLELREP